MSTSSDPAPPSDYRNQRGTNPPEETVRVGFTAGGDLGGGGHAAADEPTLAGGGKADEPTRASNGVAAEPLPDDLQGARIAGHQLLEELHRGGQGVVYRAIQLSTKRQVALKVLLEGPFASEATRRRFEREVELAASLRHPNIVIILDSGISAGRYYFAMELIDGLRLDRYLAKVRPPMRQTLRLLERICAAVNYAHQRGVIHRDLKPPNILVDEVGEPHILDFGLAKPTCQTSPEQSTVQVLSTAGQLLGTVAYMSPEQTVGSQDVDVRTDVYSLGVVFYEALLGQLPYSVDGPLGEVLTRVAKAEPARPRSVRRRSRFGGLVDDELETILLKALRKAPEQRYQTAGDLGRDLRHLLAGEPIEAKRASGWYVFRKMLGRYRVQAAAAASILVMLFMFLVVFAFLWTSERDAADRASRQGTIALQRAIEAQEARNQATRDKAALERALVQQTIQRGRLAQARGDLIAARDFYWDAYEHSQGPAARWALRQYYLRSGDAGARVLCCQRHGPIALSPDGQRAAICETPESISVRQVPDSRSMLWLRAPGPVSVLHIDNRGDVSAAGPGWARLWTSASPAPVIARELPDGFGPRAAYSASNGQRLLLVGSEDVLSVPAAAGARVGSAMLFGQPMGTADYSPAHEALAVATTAGVELVLLDDEGELRSELIGLREVQPRLVRFSGDDLLAATDEAIYASAAAGPGLGIWQPFPTAPVDWGALANCELLDLHRATDRVALGLRDGRIVVFRNGELENTWRVASGGLVKLRLTGDGDGVITVDEVGTVTRWIPPPRQHDARLILAERAAAWAVAEDGSAVLLADARERVLAYAPQRSAEAEPIPIRRGLRLRLPGSEEMALAVSRQADHVVVCMDGTIRLRDRFAGRAWTATWSNPPVDELKRAAITGDGRLIAFCAQTPAGDREQVSFWRWEPRVQTVRRVELATLLPRAAPPVEFVGSVIREMAFVPGTAQLLVARSNGELVLLSADSVLPANAPLPPAAQPRPWVRLGTPAVALAFDRTAKRLAVAGKDGFIHVLLMADGSLARRIRVGQPVQTLAFSPGGDVLLVRTVDDTVNVIESETGESVAQLRLAAAATEGFATWIGNEDTLLLGHDGGIYEHSYQATDELIEGNWAYAQQRAAARHVVDGAFAAAWEAAQNLEGSDPAAARCMQAAVLEAALRRPGREIQAEWEQIVAEDTPAATCLRLGHAAYDGEHYPQAREWLHAGLEQAGGAVDAYTALRIAQCDYLAGEYAEAAVEFTEVLGRADFAPEHVPTAQLQQAAALLLGGRVKAARAVAWQIGALRPDALHSDIGATNAARNITRTITGLEGDRPMAAIVGQLLSEVTTEGLRGFYERFYDDVHFFQGELARSRGEREDAARLYQRCIDVAQDPWPANWARYRLGKLSDGIQ